MQLCQPPLHGLGGGGLVGAGLFGDLEDDAGASAHFGRGVGGFRLQNDVRYFAQAHCAAGGQREQHVCHILYRLEFGVGTDGERLRAVFHVASGVQQVLTCQKLGDLGGGQAQTGGAGGVQFHGNLLGHAAVDTDLRHAVDPLQRRSHGILRQRLEFCQIIAGQGHNGRRHQFAEV